MKLVYFSKTGNINRLIQNLNQSYFPEIQGDPELKLDNDIILITYTTGYGQIPPEVELFCERHSTQIKYVIASGNRNWGKLFANSGNLIAARYNAELLYKLELSGNKQDLTHIRQLLKTINER